MKLFTVLAIFVSAAMAVDTRYSFCALTSEGSVARSGAVEESVEAGKILSFSYNDKEVLAYSYEVRSLFGVLGLLSLCGKQCNYLLMLDSDASASLGLCKY